MNSFIKNTPLLYVITIGISFVISLIFTPLFRAIALRFQILDHPYSDIKTHRLPTPYLGGAAIWLGWAASLFIIRFFTHFPSGTLRSLRGILWGSAIILALGLVDDILPKGLGFKKKFIIQAIAAASLFAFDIRIHFISPYFMAIAFSIIWVVGITNAFNIIDIMDGLSSGIAVIASLAFLFIAMPSEQIYVNFSAAALAGGALGFLPYNLSKSKKIFMGDTGSLTIGFILASVAMGTSYTKANEIGLFSPLLILAVPLYDTALVMFMRWKKGQSPFLGSKDHFALRLEMMGLSRKRILVITYIFSAAISLSAFFVTRLPLLWAAALFTGIIAIAIIISRHLGKVKIE